MGWKLIKTIFFDQEALLDQALEVRGWVRTQRESKNFAFIELNDGSCFKNLQVVYGPGLANFAEVAKYPLGTSLKVTGTLVASPAAGQPFELKADTIEAIGLSALDFPLQKKRHSFEFLRTIPHLRPRTNTFMAVFRVRSLVAQAIHRFFHERGFVYVHTPIITGSDCEGAGQMFRVSTLDPVNPPLTEQGTVDYSQDFFGRETNLTVSGQLNVEGFCLAFGRVYTFGPTFRAENSNTQRHASEFWMIEPEIAFADLGDDMRLAEEMLKYVIAFVLDQAPQEMEFFNRFIDPGLLQRLQLVRDASFEHVTYTRAIEILEKSGQKFNFPPVWGKDIQTEHERYLSEKVFQKPVFVTDYPKQIKAFYMRLNDDGRTVAAMDLLVPEIGEIVGGSQREERHDALQQRIVEMGLNVSDYQWYLDLRRFGGAPHAGFGLGFERAVMYLTGMENIRDVIPYPRTPKSAEF
ncbi:MAG TPA: asparagine--tRNA ligase [Candidatus Binatia bacterium]|nr:asparagine--tRNA ligase [Candidatus Binatia bacterium]